DWRASVPDGHERSQQPSFNDAQVAEKAYANHAVARRPAANAGRNTSEPAPESAPATGQFRSSPATNCQKKDGPATPQCRQALEQAGPGDAPVAAAAVDQIGRAQRDGALGQRYAHAVEQQGREKTGNSAEQDR